jgi:hypothetical protein
MDDMPGLEGKDIQGDTRETTDEEKKLVMKMMIQEE